MNKVGKKVILTETKRSGLGWHFVIRAGNVTRVMTALRNGEITGKITIDRESIFKIEINYPWAGYFQYRNLSFDETDLVFIEDDFLSDDDISI